MAKKSVIETDVSKELIAQLMRTDALGVVVVIKIKPNAAKERLTLVDKELSLSVAASPIDNAANIRVTEILAQLFLVPKSHVEIIHGHQSRQKKIRVTGHSAEDLLQAYATRPYS